MQPVAEPSLSSRAWGWSKVTNPKISDLTSSAESSSPRLAVLAADLVCIRCKGGCGTSLLPSGKPFVSSKEE